MARWTRRTHSDRRRGAAARTVAALVVVLVATLPALAGCTFDFDVDEYTYPDDRPPEGCASDADCAGRGASACAVWRCGDDRTCVEEPAADGTACDDGDPCTTATTCESGVCAGGAVACDDGLACTTDRCDPETGACVHEPDDDRCEGGAPCLAPRCDPDRGCILLPEPEGEPCDDEDPCTEDDRCGQGRCEGTAVTCEAEAPCRVATCDAAEGCVEDTAPDGSACPAPDPCAERGVCREGVCEPVGDVCECATDDDCEDGDPCTADRCDETGTCAHEPEVVGASCDDGDEATVGDACLPGGCVGWTQTSWNDRGRDTWLDGVTWSRDGFYAVGRSAMAEADAGFLARLPDEAAPVRLPGADLAGGRWWRINGGAAVGSEAHVALHGPDGWDTATALAESARALTPAPRSLRGVWAATWDDADGVAGESVWLSGEATTSETGDAAPWLARCDALADEPWACWWSGDAPELVADHAIDAVVGFVTPLAVCPDDRPTPCFAEDASVALAAGVSRTGQTPPALYRARYPAAGETWSDAHVLAGEDRAFRDLHGTGPALAWAVGEDGLIARWGGAAWTVAQPDGVDGWDLNGIWAGDDIVLIAASGVFRGPETDDATALRLAVFVGRRTGGGFAWVRHDLHTRVLCAEGASCAELPADPGALTDVWATTDEAGLPETVVAVGHVVPDEGPRSALVFRMTP